MQLRIALTTPALLAGLCLATFADTLTGRVVDSFGNPVPNVDIDLDNLGSGGDPDLTGDFTDANGVFSILVPTGLYDVILKPPTPPVTTHLIGKVAGVAVAGVVNVGQVALAPGYSLSGTTVGPTGLPLAGMDIDIRDVSTGVDLLLQADFTNAFGQFLLAVPQGPFEFQIDATSLIGQNLVSQSLDLDLSGNTNLGTLGFQQGQTLSGRIVGPTGAGVANFDIDAVDSTGIDVFTPNDDTNALGNFSIVVPAGVFDIEACPPIGSPLAGVAFFGATVFGPTNIGTLTAPQGITLSGTVTSTSGQPVSSGDIDFFVPGTQTHVFLCYENVQPNGTYSFKAPAGVYDVVFEPLDYSQPIGAQKITNFNLFSNQTLNGSLPACPFPSPYGSGTPGTGGAVPQLAGIGGAPRVGNPDFAYKITNAVGGTIGGVFLGFSQTSIPFSGGQILVNPVGIVLVNLPVTGAPGVAGAGSATLPLNIKPNFVGVSLFAQSYVADFGSPHFVTLSNAVSTTFCL